MNLLKKDKETRVLWLKHAPKDKMGIIEMLKFY